MRTTSCIFSIKTIAKRTASCIRRISTRTSTTSRSGKRLQDSTEPLAFYTKATMEFTRSQTWPSNTSDPRYLAYPANQPITTSTDTNGASSHSGSFYPCHGEDVWECQTPSCNFCKGRQETKAAREEVYRANHAPTFAEALTQLPVVPPPVRVVPPPYESTGYIAPPPSVASLRLPQLPRGGGHFRYCHVDRTWVVVDSLEMQDAGREAQLRRSYWSRLTQRRRVGHHDVGPERPFRSICIGLGIVTILIVVAVVTVQVSNDQATRNRE